LLIKKKNKTAEDVFSAVLLRLGCNENFMGKKPKAFKIAFLIRTGCGCCVFCCGYGKYGTRCGYGAFWERYTKEELKMQ